MNKKCQECSSRKEN